MNKVFLIIGVFVFVIAWFFLISLYLGNSKVVKLDSKVWYSFDITYDEKRYNMALWLFKTNWFEQKTKKDIFIELPEYGIEQKLEYKEFIYELKYSNEFMERWNIDYVAIPIACLKIYFDENDNVIYAKIIEGNKHISIEDFRITKEWKKN